MSCITKRKCAEKRFDDKEFYNCFVSDCTLINCVLKNCELHGTIKGAHVRMDNCFGDPELELDHSYVSTTCNFADKISNGKLSVDDVIDHIHTLYHDKDEPNVVYGGHIIFSHHNNECAFKHKNVHVLKNPITRCEKYRYLGLNRIVVGNREFCNEKGYPINFAYGCIIYTSSPEWLLCVRDADPHKHFSELIKVHDNKKLYSSIKKSDWIDEIVSRLENYGIVFE